MWPVNGIPVYLKSDSFLRSLDRRHVSNSASYTPTKMSPEVLRYFVAGCLCMFRRFKQVLSAFPRLLFLSILIIIFNYIYIYICCYYLLFWKNAVLKARMPHVSNLCENMALRHVSTRPLSCWPWRHPWRTLYTQPLTRLVPLVEVKVINNHKATQLEYIIEVVSILKSQLVISVG